MSLKKVASINVLSEHAYVQFMEDSKWIVVATNDVEKPLQIYGYNGYYQGSVGKGEVVKNSTVAYDPHRRWLVTNKGNNIMMFDRSGALADMDCIHSFDILSGIAFHPSTGLYLFTDLEYHCVVCYDPRGKRVVGTIGKGYGRNPENLNNPTFLCCDRLGGSSLVSVSDRKNNQVKMFNIDGQLVEVFGPRQGGERDGELSHPLGVCMDAKRRVIVCDQLNKRVVRYNSAQAADDQYNINSPALEKYKSTLRGNEQEQEKLDIPEDEGGSDLTSELSDTDTAALYDKCPISASEYHLGKINGQQNVNGNNHISKPKVEDVGSDSSGECEDLGQLSSGDGCWEAILPARALAARVDELGVFGTRYTSSVDLNSSGMLALSMYEDCYEQMNIVNLYSGYH